MKLERQIKSGEEGASVRNREILTRLSGGTQARVLGFIDREIPDARFFRPDGEPDPTWTLFNGGTWKGAYHSMVAAAEADGLTPGTSLGSSGWEHAAKKAAENAGISEPFTYDRATAEKLLRRMETYRYGSDGWQAIHQQRSSMIRIAQDGWYDREKNMPWGAVKQLTVAAVENALSSTRIDGPVLAWAACSAIVLDATLYAHYLLVSELDFPEKNKGMSVATGLWDVWRKGYLRLGDFKGKRYVCCKGDVDVPVELRR